LHLARHLLEVDEEDERTAAELFVVDIPQDDLDRVLALIAGLPEVVANVCAGETLEPPAKLNEQLLARMRLPTPEASQHAFFSAAETSEHLQIYMWTPAGRGNIDLELVFWNDLSFPRGLDEGELARRLDRLVALADACRGENSSTRCILSGEHNTDPRDLLDKPYVLVW